MASSTPEISVGNTVVREGLIDTAVRFLTNPNVADRPFQQKQSFLKSKGLTDDEIRIACERANVNASAPQLKHDTVIPMYGLPQHALAPQQTSVWYRMREVLHTLAVLGGVGYVVYWIYKSYIEPFLFGRPKPKKSTAESLASLEETVSAVSRCTSELKTEIRSELSRISQERESGAARSLSEIKSDLATVKGLLLNRQQFPSAPNSSSLKGGQFNKPSIPAWQLSTEQKNGLKEQEQNSEKDSPGSTPSEKSSEPCLDLASEDSASNLETSSDSHKTKGDDSSLVHSSVISNGVDSE